MGAKVFTIERQKELYDFVGEFFFLKKYLSVKRFYGDGYAGLPSFAPFDKVIITAGAPFLPPRLVEQLKPGGVIVAPIGDEGLQKMMRITKEMDGSLREEELGDFSFVPMLEGKNK
jgi:protein-L-isoaspartate(D-aspartate) O-methyltransferase